MEKVYYLDNAATTKTFAEDLDLFKECISDFYNPSASYSQARSVNKKLDNARNSICKSLGAKGGRFV